MKTSICIVVLCLIAAAGVPGAFGQNADRQRLAQTGMKFLSVSVHPRAAAMADAATALEASSVAMLYNPAGMARLENAFSVALGQTRWLAGTRYNAATAAFRPAGGAYGVFGLSLVAVDYGNYFLGTIRADNEQGFIDLGRYSPAATALGLGYARALTDRFSVGGNLKYVRQSLGESTMRLEGDSPVKEAFSTSTVAVDFGILYKTGFRSLNFAFAARNFSRELTYAEESFELPLTFRIGISMDVMDLTSMNQDVHALRLAVDAERPRDFAEQVRAGLEYRFMNLLSLRAGYVYPTDEQGINLGAGVQTGVGDVDLGIDYAYTEFGTFGSVNRVALQLGF